MAIFIPIRKDAEDEASALYSYGVGQAEPIDSPPGIPKGRFDPVYVWGTFHFDKRSGHAELVTLAAGDNNQVYFARAAQKVSEHWRDGLLPDETCWAS
jgi:hypothetical protein